MNLCNLLGVQPFLSGSGKWHREPMDASELKGQQMLVRYRTERGDLGWGMQVQGQE